MVFHGYTRWSFIFFGGGEGGKPECLRGKLPPPPLLVRHTLFSVFYPQLVSTETEIQYRKVVL